MRLKIKELQILRIILAILAGTLVIIVGLIITREVIRSNGLRNVDMNIVNVTSKDGSNNLSKMPDDSDKQVTQNGQIDKMQKEWNFIWDFYEHILMIKEDDWDVTDYISSSLAKRLWTEDYDGCYQVWVFRTGVNGGTGGSKIMAVKPTGKDGWYEVKYIDEGTRGKTTVHIANGLIDDYVAFDRDLQF